MATTRNAKKVITSATREQAEQAMETLAKINSKKKSLEAKIELEKQRIDEKYREQVTDLNDEAKEPIEILEVWAKADCKNWDAKSFDLTHGKVGFSTNPPKVTKDKKFTWDAITELLITYFPELVRTKVEPNKEAIIAMRNDEGFAKLQKKCYIDVVQDETFYTKTKEEELVAA